MRRVKLLKIASPLNERHLLKIAGDADCETGETSIRKDRVTQTALNST